MAERGVELSALPKEVRDQLAELDLELSEGKGGEGADGGMLQQIFKLAICLRQSSLDYTTSFVLLFHSPLALHWMRAHARHPGCVT